MSFRLASFRNSSKVLIIVSNGIISTTLIWPLIIFFILIPRLAQCWHTVYISGVFTHIIWPLIIFFFILISENSYLPTGYRLHISQVSACKLPRSNCLTTIAPWYFSHFVDSSLVTDRTMVAVLCSS